MKILGFEITPRNEIATLRAELQSVKAAMSNMPDWLLRTAEAEKYNLPDPSIYDNQMELYRKLSWIAQAIDAKASAGALTKFNVARLVAGKEPKDIPNHPFEVLLSHPNDLDSRFEFLYATIAMWTMNGNAYWWLNRESENAPPDEMWFIPPSMMRPLPDENLYLKGYIYTTAYGQEIFMEPWQIVHFRRFNPFSRFIGLSAVESIALQAVGDLGMADWNTRLFKDNNARLPGILTFEQMVDNGAWNKIKEDTREAAKNRQLLMLRGVGQGGVNWLQNAVSQKEMEFLAGRQANKKEIQDTLAPGLSTWLSETSTLANSSANRAAFNELTLYPMHVMMAEKITTSILPAYGGRALTGYFDDVRILDKDMKLREQEMFSRTHTVSEIREEYYGDAPLGDERDELFPVQITAQSAAPEPPAMPAAPEQPAQEEAEVHAPDMMDGNTDAEDSGAAMADIDKFERKALKRIGKPCTFESDFIPAEIIAGICLKLQDTRTERAVKAVFDTARLKIKSGAQTDPELDALTNLLEMAIKAMTSEPPARVPDNTVINLTAQMPAPGQAPITFSPQFSPTFAPMVEPTPVTVQNNITAQPGETTIQNNVTVQPADVNLPAPKPVIAARDAFGNLIISPME